MFIPAPNRPQLVVGRVSQSSLFAELTLLSRQSPRRPGDVFETTNPYSVRLVILIA